VSSGRRDLALRGFGECLRRGGICHTRLRCVSSERRDLVYEASVSVFGEAGSAIRGFGECLRRGGIWPYEASVSVFGEAGFGPTRLR
jgi:hypothetical protein